MKCNKLIICGFTKIYLYGFYIPELSRLANDVQTTQVKELLIQLKLLPHHTVKVMLKYLVRQMQAHNVWQCLCRCTCLKFQESNNLFRLLLRVEDAHDVTKALGVFRDLEFCLGIVSRFLFCCFTSCVSSTRSKSPSSADLVQIINIRNNMYSALSQSCKQGLLFLTDLPFMVIT